ncbi:tRNA N(3)-methylcytidine methyltransferase METTL2-like isoform X2 [Halichondria panicea]|uniref:tRNA N(3)-methylcytidine methyltransferase METTL2-like isoform X2 n=1 Tax=Halichondria panicea TaxID=6063 RepID=UPI00312BB275
MAEGPPPVHALCSAEEPEEIQKRSAFGSRFLEDPSQVFEHNAWDNVEWDAAQEQLALDKVTENATSKMTPEEQTKYEQGAAGYWHSFYQQHQNRFFKDRHWLFTEFPELKGSRQGDKFKVFETNTDPNLFIYCCDFAESAVEIVKSHDLYDTARCHAFQYDIGSHDKPLPFPPQSIDLVILIFVLSALQPEKFQMVINTLSECLRPGGMILFRDYGRHDMAQLRFKKGKCISDNFYLRGDGTRVFFFTEGEVDSLLTSAGLVREQLYTDRRLQVNRGRQVKMYRVWVQAKYRKMEEQPQRDKTQSHVET